MSQIRGKKEEVEAEESKVLHLRDWIKMDSYWKNHMVNSVFHSGGWSSR